MIWFGYFFYGAIVIVAIALTVPLPFHPPRSLQDFFGSGYGELVFFSIWLVLLSSVGILALWCLIGWFVTRSWNSTVLKLLAFVSGATVVLMLSIAVAISYFSSPYERIYVQNRDKSPNDFSNAYLRFKTVDCRDISTEYGIVFISNGIAIETDYLSYAPERPDKTVGYRHGRKFGDDWYWDNTGSQWDRDLFNCVNRNKAPRE